jgi:predicted acyl esterase
MLTVVATLLLLIIAAAGTFATTASATTPTPTAATGLGTPPAVEEVKISLSDGTEIVANYYASMFSGRQAPAVLLLHQNGGNKEEWRALIPSLQAAGYAVLAVDQRGFGKTGGTRLYGKLDADALELVAWLEKQPSIKPGEVALIGASVGANAAILACAKLDTCKVVIGLSPGLSYFGLNVAPEIKKVAGKSMLFVAGQRDQQSAGGFATMLLAASAKNNVLMRLYADTSAHGVSLFQFEDLAPSIVSWLNMYNYAE